MQVCVHSFVPTGIASPRSASRLHYTSDLPTHHLKFHLKNNEISNYTTYLSAIHRNLGVRHKHFSLHMAMDGASCLLSLVGLSLIIVKLTRIINVNLEWESIWDGNSSKRTIRMMLSA